MKVPRARFQMETAVVEDSRFCPAKSLELFSNLPFMEIPAYNKAAINSVDIDDEKDDEKIEDKKRKQRKKRILTGVSRQRRAANDRERRRNVRLNQAFVTLKKALPLANIDISKIEILRLAVKWIDHLATLLKDNEEQKDLLTLRQMKTSPSSDENAVCDNMMQGQKSNPIRHDCLYHQEPNLKNTLWEDCIGLPKRSCDDNEGCIHIRSNSRFHELFS